MHLKTDIIEQVLLLISSNSFLPYNGHRGTCAAYEVLLWDLLNDDEIVRCQN